MFGYKAWWTKLYSLPIELMKNRLGAIEFTEKTFARKIVGLIPSQCPFAREIYLFNKPIAKIPPLCKLNPLYDDLMMLCFRALSFLCEIGEDVTPYC